MRHQHAATPSRSESTDRPPIDLVVEVAHSGHQALCADFDCGGEAFHEPLNSFIREGLWVDERARGETLVARDGQDGPVIGFAAWRYAGSRWDTGRPPPGWTPPTLIRMVWLALDTPYHGTRTSDDRPVAADFYATVEERALKGERSVPPMFVETFCDHRNSDALKFWECQGFTDIGPAFGRPELRRLVRHASLPEGSAEPG